MLIFYQKIMIKKKIIYKCAIFGISAQTLNFHIKAIESFSNVKLVGVIEKNKNKLNNFLKNNKNIKGYSNFNDFGISFIFFIF